MIPRKFYDPAYMERRAHMYMRNWIANCDDDQSVVDEIFRIAAQRLEWAGILTDIDPDGGSKLTPLGQYVVEKLNEFSFNFWPIQQILDPWPLSALKDAELDSRRLRESPSPHIVINFLAVFQLDFQLDKHIQEYMKDRKDEFVDGFTDLAMMQTIMYVERPSVDFTVAADNAGDFDVGRTMTQAELADRLAEARSSPSSTTRDEIDRQITVAATAQYLAEREIREAAEGIDFDGMLNADPHAGSTGHRVSQEACGVCEGTGVDPFDEPNPCPACHGAAPDLADDEDWDIL